MLSYFVIEKSVRFAERSFFMTISPSCKKVGRASVERIVMRVKIAFKSTSGAGLHRVHRNT